MVRNTKILPGLPISTVERSIHLALDFLSRSQLKHGEFRTCAAENEAMDEACFFDSSPFTTSFVLYSLGFFQDARIRDMTARGLTFLQSEMEGRGVWRYWSSHNQAHSVLPPDLDDTACISFVLKQHGRMPANRDVILANRNREGLFYTWLAPREQTPVPLKKEIHRLAKAGSLPFFSMSGTLENIDPSVNANVVLYLGDCDETRAAIDYLKHTVTRQQMPDSGYYVDPLAFHYLLSRAYLGGVAALGDVRSAVLKALLSKKGRDGSFGNELLTALAVCTWLNFNAPRDQLKVSIDCLVRAQEQNGSWRKSPMWLGPAPYYGSEELTTGFCIEALGRSIQ